LFQEKLRAAVKASLLVRILLPSQLIAFEADQWIIVLNEFIKAYSDSQLS
jgi:hypothetical protein